VTSRVRALVLVAFMASAWLIVGGFATGPRADAHAVIEEAVPAQGELLQDAPADVVITFTEPPDPDLSTLRVLDATGRGVTDGPTEIDPRQRQMRAPLGDLTQGVYTVAWRAVSQTDGHVTAGSYSFGVGVEPPSDDGGGNEEVVTSSPGVASVVGRSALYWGLSLLLAAGTLGASMLAPIGLPRALLVVAWALAAIGICVMTAAAADSVGVSLGSMLSTATGRPLVQQAASIGVAGVGVGLYLGARARALKRAATWVVSAAAAATMLFHAGAGHAGAARSWRWFDVGVQFVHIVATGLWIGGLVWLLLSIRRLDGDARTRAISRFSSFAGVNLAVVVATGVARELDELGGPGNLSALFDTSFGIALLVKLGLFVLLVLFAARNRFRNIPRLESDQSGARSVARTVSAEVLVAVAILGVTGALSQLPPPASAQEEGRASTDRVVVRGSDFATTLRAELTVTPGTVGANRFELRVRDYDTAEPYGARRVSLIFSFPDRPELTSTLLLAESTPGLWTADGTQLSLQGLWEVDARVESADDSVEVSMELRTRRPSQDIEITRQEGQPTLYTIQLGGGGSVQTYVDPGTEGVNNVHFTFFDDAGGELAVRDLGATATSPGGELVVLETRKFSAGHYVSNAELEAGRWEFDFTGTAEAGSVSG
jgi:copper transport protein